MCASPTSRQLSISFGIQRLNLLRLALVRFLWFLIRLGKKQARRNGEIDVPRPRDSLPHVPSSFHPVPPPRGLCDLVPRTVTLSLVCSGALAGTALFRPRRGSPAAGRADGGIAGGHVDAKKSAAAAADVSRRRSCPTTPDSTAARRAPPRRVPQDAAAGFSAVAGSLSLSRSFFSVSFFYPFLFYLCSLGRGDAGGIRRRCELRRRLRRPLHRAARVLLGPHRRADLEGDDCGEQQSD